MMESIGKLAKKKFAASVTFLFGNRTKYNPIVIWVGLVYGA
jgi:hypothetical protein